MELLLSANAYAAEAHESVRVIGRTAFLSFPFKLKHFAPVAFLIALVLCCITGKLDADYREIWN